MAQGIYEIINLCDGRATSYVGSSMDIKRRWQDHEGRLRGGQHRNEHLQRAWDKYGEGAFSFCVLELIDDQACLLRREQHFLDRAFRVGNTYNIAKDATATRRGIMHTDEAKHKMSEAQKGKRLSEEHCRKIGATLKGRQLSEEHRRKIGAALKGKKRPGQKHTKEHRRKNSEARKGKKHTEETKRKMSESAMGNQNGLGYKHTEDAKRRMSQAAKRRWGKRSALP